MEAKLCVLLIADSLQADLGQMMLTIPVTSGD